jgi:tetratricopeptide (TPR) repeat protein
MPEPRKVFLSYRSIDRDRVRPIAAALRAHGIDAWWDTWEIAPGDNFVSKINEGLKLCECGIVFLSNASLAGPWHQDEITTLKVLAVEKKLPLIPVLLDPDIDIDPILLPYSRLSADQIPELAVAILNRAANKPSLGPAAPSPTRARFTIHLRELPNNTGIAVSAQLDNKPLVPEQTVTPGANFAFSYADFLRARPILSRQHSPSDQAAQELELFKLGDAVGRVVFPAEIDNQLSAILKNAAQQELELVFESASPHLLSIPFESARLANGSAPALTSGVFVWRTLPPPTHQTTAKSAPVPGPLKILVAIGAPDENKTRNSVLDIERELHTILNSVEKARNLGNAYVRILETGSPSQIGLALRQLSYHVLHLSGHGNKGILELEDEDGTPVPTTAAQIAAEIKDSTHPPPLVVLASCHGGLGDNETSSLAQGLLAGGVPAVLAMQTSVSDAYCTALTGKFYEKLSIDEQPFPSRALAAARRELEHARQNASPKPAPEYATPSLFLNGGQEQPVLNRAADQVPVVAPSRLAAGTVPLLKEDELIGRRREARTIIRILTDDPKSIAQFGHKAGCQVLGTGGVGKSSIAGRIMQRMADRGWFIATPRGWGLSNIAGALSAALWKNPDKNLAKLAEDLSQPAPDELRFNWFQTILNNVPVLLVLDNFEDLLTPAGTAFKDPLSAQIFSFLAESCQRAKLLVTSRYPVPTAEAHLHRINLGPLSAVETRKLILRHEGLNRESGENLKLIERAIGGHPRTLEYLDALLRNGTAKLSAVQARLNKFAEQEGIALSSAASFEGRLREAIRIAAADAMVAELVRVVGQNSEDLALLWQSSVFPFAVPVEALAFNPAEPKAEINAAPLAAPIRRLAATSLLTPLEGNHLYVHRWTAESLKPLMSPETFKACCLHAAQYLNLRPYADLSQFVTDLTEAVTLFLSAQSFDDAIKSATSLILKLQPLGQTILWTELARQVNSALPPEHDDKSRFLLQESDGLRILGLGPQALSRCEEALHLNEQKVAREPGRADYLRDLSVSYNTLGDLQSDLGNGEAARQFFEKSLDITERLVQQEPGRADYLRDLSISYNNLGDLQSALGNGQAARQFFEKSLDITERLVQQEPGRADYLRDLSVSYNTLGDLQSGLGDGEAARQFFEKSLDIRERLVQQEPSRTDYLRDLSVSYERLGDLHSALGHGQAARQFFEKSLDIRERLVQQEPSRADYLRDLSVSYNKLGDLQSDLGNGEAARQFFEKSLDIRERLVQQEPGRADYLRDLSNSYERLGDLQTALGNAETARQFFEKSLEIRERLVQQEPERADYLRDLVVSMVKLGSAHHLQRALDIVLDLQKTNRLNKTDEWMVADLQKRLQSARSTSA